MQWVSPISTVIAGTLLFMPFPTTAATAVAQPSALDLVRAVASNELAAAQSPGHRRYQLVEQTAKGSETRDTIETKNYSIGRVIAENGKPLTPARFKQESERLNGMLNDRSQLRKLENEESSNKAHYRSLIKEMPNACLYRYADREPADATAKVVRVEFRYNPDFPLQSWEMRPLGGLEGVMHIDPVAKRLVRLEAKLIRDISFGWGLLGHIAKGGTFEYEQRDLGKGQYALNRIKMTFNSRRLLISSTQINTLTTISEFQNLPENLSLRKGLERLMSPAISSKARAEK